ncbi:conjugal transfer protein [Listeria booriae]|uniref:conjugal transfer protein n=1 Tax=Listeria booriae TaxID=1552123 RepID=UPI001627BCE9|nr:conjugal transfer protein [Listeria booriae]MBC1559434.1 conjugal transfer protein [Listeria booriae]
MEEVPKKSWWRRIIAGAKTLERPKKQRGKLQRDHSRLLAFWLYTLLFTILFFACIGILLALNTRSIVNDLERESVQPKVTSGGDIGINVVAGNNFLQSFIQTYMTVVNDAQKLEEREKQLQVYMVKTADGEQTTSIFSVQDIKGNRTLKSVNLYNTQTTKEGTLFQYKVSYVNELPTTKVVEKVVPAGKGKTKKVKNTVKTTQAVSQEALLNIPVVSNGEGYAVKEAPYFTEIYPLQAKVTQKKSEPPAEYDGTEKKDIDTFVVDFFSKYASASKADMAYMMKEPESLEGMLAFDNVVDTYVVKTKTGLQVQATVQFRDKTVQIPTSESFTINIIKKEGQYFVTKLSHERSE